MPEVVSLYPGRSMRDFRFLSSPSTKFLLQEGMEFVLTERFCQDPEEYFGNQLKLGQQSENCAISSFGSNNNTIRSTLQTFLYDVGRNLDQVNLPLISVPFM